MGMIYKQYKWFLNAYNHSSNSVQQGTEFVYLKIHF